MEKKGTPDQGFRARIGRYVMARYPALAIQTAEETRAFSDLLEVARAEKQELATWSAVEGLKLTVNGKPIPDTQDLLPACKELLRQDPQKVMVVFRDAQTFTFDRDPLLSRALRDVLAQGPESGRVAVFLGPSFKPYPSIEKMVTVLDYDLPSREELAEVVAGIAISAKRKDLEKADPATIRALGGLSVTEAENALSLSLVETGSFDPKVIYREKMLAVRRSGLLEIVDPDPKGLSNIGGLGELKAWILQRASAFTEEAAKYGLPAPKGVLLAGVPGTGKSLAAKAIGTALAVPTLRLDIGALFGSLVGESESRAREALKLAEALAPCVLWVEEIEKGLAGSGGSGNNDSGTTKRVFGTILSWLQEKRRPVFLVATANEIQSLPPEFYRKGRFDEVFAVDLPTLEERKEIARVILQRRNRDPEKFDLVAIADATDAYTGSEVEATIDAGMFSAFSDGGREVETEDIVQATKSIIPLAVMAREKVEAIRQWAQSNARPAGTPEVVKEAPKVGSRRLS